MQIVSNDLRLDFENSLQVLDGLFEEAIALHIFQIADMLAEKRVLSLRQADRILQLSADRQNRWHVFFEKHWTWTNPRDRRS